jgi:hypothetical protein
MAAAKTYGVGRQSNQSSSNTIGSSMRDGSFFSELEKGEIPYNLWVEVEGTQYESMRYDST